MDSAEVQRSLTSIQHSFRDLKRSAQVNINNLKFDSKNLESYRENVNELSKSFDNQKKNVDDLRASYDKAVIQYGENSVEARKLRIEYNKQGDELNKLGRILDNARKDLAELEQQQKQSQNQWKKTSDVLDKLKTKLNGISDGFKDVGTKMTAGLTTSLTGVATGAVASAVSVEQSTVRMQNALGLTEKEAKKLAETGRSIYKAGFGESLDEVDNAVIQVKQNIKGLNNEQLETVTKNALTLAKTFDADVNEVTRAGQNVMKGFGVDAEEAFDLMGHGAQNGLNFSNEMFDNLSEYAPLFSKMGFSAQDYFDLLIKGSEAGVYNLDYINDVMKEFQIRIKDGSKTTTDAMGQLSSETQEVWKEFLKGDATVKDVSNAVLAELEGMDNQVKANEIGVGLFGTKWEDLESDAMYALGGIDGELQNVDGTMDKMNKNLENSPLQRMSSLWRELKSSIVPFGEVLLDVAERLMPKVQEMLSGLTEKLSSMSPAMQNLTVITGAIGVVLGPVIAGVGLFAGAMSGMFGVISKGTKWIAGKGSISEAFKTMKDKIGPLKKVFSGIKVVAMALFKPLAGLIAGLSWPITLTVAGITALATGFVLAYKKSETFRNFIDGIKDKFSKGLEWIGKFKDGILGLFKDDGVQGTDILTSIGLSENMAQKLWDITGYFIEFKDKIVGVFENVKGKLTAFISMFKGDWMEGRSILQNLGMSDDQIIKIENVVIKIKKNFHDLKEKIGIAVGMAKDLFTSAFNSIKSWWDENGQTILSAITSGFEWMKETIGLTLDLIKAAIGFAFRVIKGTFETFSGILKGIWNTLWSVISETIKIFAPIVKGILSALWTSATAVTKTFFSVFETLTKTTIAIVTEAFRIFSPIIKGIWNTLWPVLSAVLQGAWSKMKLIVGTAMDLIQGIIKTATAILNGDWSLAWESIRETVSSIKDRILTHLDEMKTIAIDLFQKLTSGAIEWFQNLWQNITDKATSLKDSVVGKFTELKDGATGAISNLASGAVEKFQNLKTNITEKATGIKDSVVGRITEMKDKVVAKVSSMLEPVITPFMKIYEGVSSRMSALKDILAYIFGLLKNILISIVKAIYERISSWFMNIYNKVYNIANKIYSWVSEKFRNMRDSVVSTVSNLYSKISTWFTNTFKKVSTIVNNIRSKVTSVYSNMRDKVVSIISNLYRRVSKLFSNIYNSIKDKVTKARNVASQIIGNMRDRIVGTVKNLYSRVSGFFSNIYNSVRDRTRKTRDTASSTMGSLRDRVVGTIKNLYSRIRGYFQNIYSTIRDKMSAARQKAVNFATSMKDGALKQFTKLSDGAKNMMNKIGQWIDDKRAGVVKKAKNLGVDIANGAIKGFNKLIGGVNGVADMLGYKGSLVEKIPTVSYYNRGTKNHQGGMAVVGDKGVGNSARPGVGGNNTREIVKLPNNGGNYLFNEETLIPNLPKGAKVLSNKETEKFFNGKGSGSNKRWNPISSITNGAKSAWNGTKKAASNVYNKGKNIATGAYNKVSGFVSDIWDYAKDPGKLVSDMIGKLNLGFDLPDSAFKLATLGVKKLKSVMTDYIGKLFEDAEGSGDGSHILSKRITAKFGRYPKGINFNGGRHYGLDTAHVYDKLKSPINGVITKIWRDYGGGNSIQMKAGKYNWWFMHMRNIAKKVGDSIKAGDVLGTTGNTGNFTTGPHLHTQVMKGGIGNGYAINPLPILKNLKGHEFGGLIQKDGLYRLGEKNKEEMVIPLNHPTEAMKLIALAGKKMAGKSKQTKNLPNVSMGNDNSDELLEAALQQNKLLMKVIEKLTGIEQKENVVSVKEVIRSTNKYTDDRSIFI